MWISCRLANLTYLPLHLIFYIITLKCRAQLRAKLICSNRKHAICNETVGINKRTKRVIRTAVLHLCFLSLGCSHFTTLSLLISYIFHTGGNWFDLEINISTSSWRMSQFVKYSRSHEWRWTDEIYGWLVGTGLQMEAMGRRRATEDVQIVKWESGPLLIVLLLCISLQIENYHEKQRQISTLVNNKVLFYSILWKLHSATCCLIDCVDDVLKSVKAFSFAQLALISLYQLLGWNIKHHASLKPHVWYPSQHFTWNLHRQSQTTCTFVHK